MNKTGYEIFALKENDLPAVVDILCDSFFDYPVMRFVINSEINYKHKLKTLMKFFVLARIYRSETILGIGERSNISGVALISYPNNTTNPLELKDLRDQVWSELGDISKSRYIKFSNVCAQFQVDVPHIHLNMIGIKQGAQGLGLGRKLMDRVHLLSLNDSNSKGVTLTTEDPTKVSFYKYLGYELIGETYVAPLLKTWSFFRPD